MAEFGESIPQLFFPLVLVFLYLATLVGIAEFLSRSFQDDPEITRKVVHIGSGNVILFAWWLGIEAQVIVIAAAIAAVIALVSYFTTILPSINSVGRKSLGTLFYAISIGVLTWLFWEDYPQYTAIGILVMTWGDGLAAVIGQRFGKHPYSVLGMNKSWEGSAAMAIATFVVTFSILATTTGTYTPELLNALLVALIATGLEAFSKFGLDNLTVPIASSLICYYCHTNV